MTSFVSPGERDVMTAIGRRMLDEVRALVLAEGKDPDDAELFAYHLTSKAADCIMLAQVGRADLCAVFSGLGVALGAVYAQQPRGQQPFLHEALAKAMEHGMVLATQPKAKPVRQ